MHQDRLLNGSPRVLHSEASWQWHEACRHVPKLTDEGNGELRPTAGPREGSDSETHFPPWKDVSLVDILRLLRIRMINQMGHRGLRSRDPTTFAIRCFRKRLQFADLVPLVRFKTRK